MASYFLLSVSTRQNLDLCMKYGWAGFTNSINGLWTFLDIEVGDFVSFLYGARVYNLYQVVDKAAFRDADSLPPWPKVTFRSGYTYFFPFRLSLRQVRRLNEPMVRPEFAYVAENLLLRGGYRRTHFQADHVTFNQVSRMGKVQYQEPQPWDKNAPTFIPKIGMGVKSNTPYLFQFRELLLQALLRKHFSSPPILKILLNAFGIEDAPETFEVLGEKALPEGFVDMVIKHKHPEGQDKLLLVEVKTGTATSKDVAQISNYLHILGEDAVGGILVARKFPKKACEQLPQHIHLVKYSFENTEKGGIYDASALLNHLSTQVVC